MDRVRVGEDIDLTYRWREKSSWKTDLERPKFTLRFKILFVLFIHATYYWYYVFWKKNQEGKIAERGDGSLCSEDSRILGSECRECRCTRTNVSEVQTDGLIRVDAGNTHLHNLGTYYISLYTASSPGNENHRHRHCENCIPRVSTCVLHAVPPDAINLHTRRKFQRAIWPVKMITASEIIIYSRGSPG